MAKKEWSISLKREFYKDIFGIALFPFMLCIFTAIVFIVYLSPTIEMIKGDRPIKYSDQVGTYYAETNYNDIYGTSSAPQDNMVIVFFANKDCDQYYCLPMAGSNIRKDVASVFAGSESVFGKAMRGRMDLDRGYKYTLDEDLAYILGKAEEKIASLSITSSFKTTSDRGNIIESHIVNNTDIELSGSLDAAIKSFTEETDISVTVIIDKAESVFGLKTPTSNILFLVAFTALSIFYIVKATIKIVRRVRFEKNPQLFYKPTIYDQNSEDDGY